MLAPTALHAVRGAPADEARLPRLSALRRALAGVLLVASAAATAQHYPARAVRMIVPAGAGGGADTVARVIAQPLGEALGQAIVVDNRPGAGTTLASELLAKSPPDGYTALLVTNSHAINASLHRNLRYDPVADFLAVTLVASVPYFVVVHPSVPARSVGELVSLAKKRPGDLYFGSAGSGSGTHLAGELLADMAGIRLVHVPHKGGSAALVSLLAGEVQLMVSNTINSRPYVLSGKLRALAITAASRSSLYPDIPTVAEAGLPGYQADVWYGVFLPARTPADVAGRLNREIVAALRTPKARERLAALGAEILGTTPEEFLAVLKNDIGKWAKVTARLKLQMN